MCTPKGCLPISHPIYGYSGDSDIPIRDNVRALSSQRSIRRRRLAAENCRDPFFFFDDGPRIFYISSPSPPSAVHCSRDDLFSCRRLYRRRLIKNFLPPSSPFTVPSCYITENKSNSRPDLRTDICPLLDIRRININ